MAREVRLMLTCKCGEWDVQIHENEAKAEERLRVRGWSVNPEKCPACKAGRKKPEVGND